MIPKIGILIACRMKSQRLTRKAVLPIVGKPMIIHQIERMKSSKFADEIVLCSSTHMEDQELKQYAEQENIKWFAGSEEDVLGRFIAAAEQFGLTHVVRVTGDNPLTDPEYIDRLIDNHFATESDFSRTEQLPIGMNAEVISLWCLKKAHELADDPNKSEYMTAYLKQPKYFKINIMDVDELHSEKEMRLTVDYQEDLDVMERIYSALYYNGRIFSITEIVTLLNTEKDILELNNSIDERPLPKVSMGGELDPNLKNVVIVGADLNGPSGDIIKKIRNEKSFNILGLLDDDEKHQYLQYDGIPVIGRVSNITKDNLPENSSVIVGLDEGRQKVEEELRKEGINVISL
ncbi:MAG: hypothetical protein CMH61_02795 [Nanoarchaeota archaeon]|nr:hypothetical protein [Nanoarchaeota archaeon]|tara:strand:- start:3429 stop:4469 length:1041 start_codon:yes stop_codon:yes gene_type:complete